MAATKQEVEVGEETVANKATATGVVVGGEVLAKEVATVVGTAQETAAK